MRLHTRRSGFTLIEMIISMIIVSVLGIAFIKLLVLQSRFFEQQNARGGARAVDRNAINVMLSELRMVQDSGGVDSLSSKLVRVRVPYRFGLTCGSTATALTASMLPVDSAVNAMAQYAGYAYRDSVTGRYKYVATTTAPATSGSPTTCTTTRNIQTLTVSGKSGGVYDLKPGTITAATRQPVFLWQKVTYQFKASTAYPGYYGLYRTAVGGSTEELIAPFDTSASFRIYRQGSDTSTKVFTLLDTSLVRGLDIVLPGRSSQVLVNHSTVGSNVMMSVFFKNTRSF